MAAPASQEPVPVVDLESMTMPDKIIHIVGQKPEGMRLSAVAAAVGLSVGEDRTKLVLRPVQAHGVQEAPASRISARGRVSAGGVAGRKDK
jgi:ribosomal protein L12E/L44/L45/RPP1/RPP2